jgi:hypothetical protein
LGVGLFIVGILLLAILLNRVVRRIRYRYSGRLGDHPPEGANVLLIIIAIVLIVLAQCFFWLSSQIQYFRPVGRNGTIGTVAVQRTDDPIRSLRVSYIPGAGDSAGMENQFYLSGDSWRFSGEIINFKFADRFLKLPSKCYKTTEFNSRFLERLPPNTTGALLHEQILEGGSSGAFSLFRDRRFFRWFATVDSFSTDFVTTEKIDVYAIKLLPDRTVELIPGGR